MNKLAGWGPTLAAALVLAVVSTLFDLVWALWIPAHRAVFGLAHGAILFMIMGVVLGVVAARSRPEANGPTIIAGTAIGALVAGLAAAAAFYALFETLRWGAMFVAWMFVWVLTALVNRWARANGESVATTMARGTGAAVFSGAAFWAISGIWLDGSTRDPNYLVNLASWFVAFLPGFAFLLLEARADTRDSS